MIEFSNKRVLLISPEPWDHIFVSKHHYARTLAERGNHVFFANPPQKEWQLNKTDVSGLQVVDYPKFIKGLRKLPGFVSQRLILRKYKQIERLCQTKFDIVWSFDNSVFFDFTLLPTYNISHIVDLNQNFETERAAKTADICFYTTEFIGQRLRKYNSNTHFINHGFNEKPVRAQKELPGHSPFKIMYAGNLNMPYLDWENVLKAIDENVDADFIFLGPLNQEKHFDNPTWSCLQDLLLYERAYFLGKVGADELPDYYASADVLIICYQEIHHADQANPHKMMEYLGTGKAIVATYTSTFSEYLKPLIVMCERNIEFASQLYECLENLAKYNSEEIREARKQIAMDNRYSRQIDRIESKIGANV